MGVSLVQAAIMIFVFAGVGALSRFGLQSFLPLYPIPVGTLFSNIIGSFVIGLVGYSLQHRTEEFKWVLLVAVSVGLLGALTTFSSFALESVKLFDQGQYIWALLYITLTNGFCLSACYFSYKWVAPQFIS